MFNSNATTVLKLSSQVLPLRVLADADAATKLARHIKTTLLLFCLGVPHLLAVHTGLECDGSSQWVADVDSGAGLIAHRTLQAEAAQGCWRSAGELDLVECVFTTGLILEGDAGVHQPLAKKQSTRQHAMVQRSFWKLLSRPCMDITCADVSTRGTISPVCSCTC